MTNYNPQAVDNAIAQANRRTPISSRERKMIHAILKGAKVMYGTTKERATKLAAKANELIKTGWRPSNLDRGRNISRVDVQPHSWNPNHSSVGMPSPKTWGLNPRWAYDDRPDLGANFGGPFIPLRDVT